MSTSRKSLQQTRSKRIGLVDMFAEDPAPTKPSETVVGKVSTSKPTSWLGKWAVDDLVTQLDKLLTKEVGIINVVGEISGFTSAASGHWYFQLKGADHLIKCVMFRPQAAMVRIKPVQGIQVEITAVVGLYRPRGDLQLQVKSLQPAGVGALYAAFVALRESLEQEGWFSATRKKPLPAFPRTIGIITSLATAALQDVLKICRAHSPHLSIIVYPAMVQGQTAAQDLLRAFNQALSHQKADVLLFARGGGSMEDLWCFNDETLIKAVAQSPIPTISGVGHETDTTLIDLVVDIRAPTPTAAAHMLPSTEHFLAINAHFSRTLSDAIQNQLSAHQQRLDINWRLLKSLRELFGGAKLQNWKNIMTRQWQWKMREAKTNLTHLTTQFSPLLSQRIAREKQHLEQLTQVLKAYDPALPQKQGYALVKISEGGRQKLVHSAKDLSANNEIIIDFQDGEVSATVHSSTRHKKKRGANEGGPPFISPPL